jgi:hypothetical protein
VNAREGGLRSRAPRRALPVSRRRRDQLQCALLQLCVIYKLLLLLAWAVTAQLWLQRGLEAAKPRALLQTLRYIRAAAAAHAARLGIKSIHFIRRLAFPDVH